VTGYLERVRGLVDVRTFHVTRCEVTGRESRVPATVGMLESALGHGIPIVEVRRYR
jgi:hypothetical protein